MTITDQILIAANILANAGKKPTVALIKANLNQTVPLPLLIKTLKTWQHQPEFITIKHEPDESKSHALTKSKEELRDSDAVKAIIQETLAAELKHIKAELCDMKQLIEELKEQLKRTNKN